MNEVLSDTDNPSHLHLDLESNIFFLQKTYLPNYSPLDTMLQSVYPLHLRRKSLETVGKRGLRPTQTEPKQMRDQQPRWPNHV